MDEERIQSGPRRVLWLTVILAAGALVIIAGFLYNRQQQNRDANESRASAQSLCIVQNENRKQTRANTFDLYKLVVAVLGDGGPADPQTRKVFERAEAKLSARLKALKPINCETYVRPELPLPTVLP